MQRRTALRLLASTPLAAGLVACTPQPTIHTQGFLLYGMLIQLSLLAGSRPSLDAALNEVEHIFKQEYAVIHPWQDSPLLRLNSALPKGEWLALDPSLRPWIEQGTRLEQQTLGFFSPAIGALVRLWGFHGSPVGAERSPPSADALQALMSPPPRMGDLEIDGERIRSHNPHVQLDFNAIAEGMVGQRVMQRLSEQGITDALLDTGGDVLLRGQAGKRAWRLAIQNPFAEGALASLELSGTQALFTSGSYRKQFSYQGRRYSHVINPHTGWPAHGLVSSSVLTADAALADAAATALLAAGKEHAPALAEAMRLHDVLLIDEQGQWQVSASLEKRLQPLVPPSNIQHLAHGALA